MNTDRMSTWLDDELEKTELETLLSEFSSEGRQEEYFVYQAMRSAMQGRQEIGTYADHSSAIGRLLAKLDEEPPVKKTALDHIKHFINVEALSHSLRRNWVPLTTAVAAVSAVMFYPVQNEPRTPAELIQQTPSGSIVRASATEITEITDGRIDGYLHAHEGIAAVAVPHGGGLASLRTIVYSEDLTQ